MSGASKQKLEKRQREDWEKWAEYWKLLGECARPSNEDLHLFGASMFETLKNTKGARIVILGSTPELRDLATLYSLNNNAEVICVELVPTMYRAMQQLVTLTNKNEELVVANWMSMPLSDGTVDMVIGDLAEGQINYDLKVDYLCEIHRILRNGGKYLTRVTAYRGKEATSPLVTVKDIAWTLETYKEKVLRGDVTIKQAGNYFGAELIWNSWYKSTNNKISLSYFSEELEEVRGLAEKDNVQKQIIEVVDMIWGQMKDKYWDYLSFDETEKQYKNKFKNIKYGYSNDYPVAKYTAVFEMEK